MIELLQNRSTGAQLVTDALATRTTVRVTFHRCDETLSVAVIRGSDVLRPLACGLRNEEFADSLAADYATALGLDVSRVDVD